MDSRLKVYKAIDSERDYQTKEWPNSQNLSTSGEIILLQRYTNAFLKHYAEAEDAPGFDTPMECLNDIRKMAAILVRCMENHGALFREE